MKLPVKKEKKKETVDLKNPATIPWN